MKSNTPKKTHIVKVLKHFFFKVRVYLWLFYYSVTISKKVILFESYPTFSGNTEIIFEELYKRKLNRKYCMVWCKRDAMPPPKRCVFVDIFKQNAQQTGKYRAIKKKTVCIISSSRFFSPFNIHCISLYVTHGVPLKETHDYYYSTENIDYCLSTSPETAAIIEYSLRIPKEKILPLGFPRNDVLSHKSCISLDAFWGYHKKYIVWYPTYRQHIGGGITGSNISIPLIYNTEDAQKLNDIAAKFGVFIIIKPHFSQRKDNLVNLNLSNIDFIDDTFFAQHKISSYDLINSCDALLSDYSSVYYDYLLCDKPIGLIWEDIEDYKRKPGLIQHYEEYCRGGEKIYNIYELCDFIDRVSKGIDILKVERNEICNRVHSKQDGHSAERVVDFMITHIKA